MPAYVIAQLEVTDPVAYEKYKAASPPTIAAAGGRYIARGGEPTVLEGAYDGRRIVVLEFPTVDAAKSWYTGSSYKAARELREDLRAQRHLRRRQPSSFRRFTTALSG